MMVKGKFCALLVFLHSVHLFATEPLEPTHGSVTDFYFTDKSIDLHKLALRENDRGTGHRGLNQNQSKVSTFGLRDRDSDKNTTPSFYKSTRNDIDKRSSENHASSPVISEKSVGSSPDTETKVGSNDAKVLMSYTGVRKFNNINPIMLNESALSSQSVGSNTSNSERMKNSNLDQNNPESGGNITPTLSDRLISKKSDIVNIVSTPGDNILSEEARYAASTRNVEDARRNELAEYGRRVSYLLDSLLMGYDRRLRPGFGQVPLTVKADIEIRSMGPISEKDMIYSMDCYFRQVWVDRRLAFNSTQERVSNVTLNLKMLERIWHPDTYFLNGGPSYVHTITTPNKFIRLSHDGTMLYSQRLTIKANCPMHLEKFPMDSQKCPLYIASFGYPESDVIYEWHYGSQYAAVAATDMRLSQFDLKGMPAGNTTKNFKGSPHSILTVFFDFRRHTGFFLIQVYLPCCLLVILSWVSFWINREATSDRISLGATTMLTMTFLVLDSRNDLPRVAYSTALDVYVALCFSFVFASIVQFAAVHFFTKYGTADNDINTTLLLDTDSEEDGDDMDADDLDDSYLGTYRQAYAHGDLKPDSLTACLRKMWRCLMSTRAKRFNKNVRNALGLNSVSKIDKVSRFLFPASFVALNIVYWISYW